MRWPSPRWPVLRWRASRRPILRWPTRRLPGTRSPVRRFAVFAVALTGLRDLVPLYAVYALLFRAEGLSDAAISALFLIWSLTSFLAEVPSGVWADLVSRRLLLCLGSLLTATGFLLWLLVPTFAGFAAGFVLWGVGGALSSGTWQSLVHDALTAHGATDRCAGVIGGGESAGWLAAVLAAALATPLLAVGGHAAVGWSSVAVTVLHAGLCLLLPDPPRTGIDPDEALDEEAPDGQAPDGQAPDGQALVRDALDHHEAGPVEASPPDMSTTGAVRDYLDVLAAGMAEATRHPPVRRAVVGLSLLTGLLAFDEYLPLLAAETGVATATVPLLMTLTFLAQAVASAAAGRVAHLDPRWPPRLLAVGAVLLCGGALSGHPVGFAAVALGHALATCVTIVLDARLQEAITGPARATVTSTVGVGSELVAVAVFAGYAGGSRWLAVPALVALNALPLLGLARRLGRWAAGAAPGSRPARR